MRKLFTLFVSVLAALTLHAQELRVSGTVLDADNGEALIGVSVVEKGTTNGIVTDLDGNFTLTVQKGATLQLSYVGYSTEELKAKANLGVIKLTPEAVTLQDVTITGQMAQQSKTPVAVSQVTALEIEERIAGGEFPEVLKNTPGVHANGQGGGWGDSEIWMRGFDNTNVATMINGVPMNDMEGGTVYWSNWQGLSDVTSVMQTQRGMGASKVSAPSVGGTINIVTKGIDAKRGGVFSYSMGNDGANKLMFSVSTGLMKNGWAITVLGSKSWGNGYIQGTGYSGYSYFANISKRINENHQLSLTGFGAPQWHWTRPSGNNGALTLAQWNEVKKYMTGGMDYRRYNPAYGYANNGKQKGANYNQYHKPQISLNHVWQIDYKSSLSTSLYTSIGRGFGNTAEPSPYSQYAYSDLTRGAYNGVLTTVFRRADGSFDYGAVEDLNAASETGSQLILAENRNDHNWYGLVSTYNNKFLDEKLDLTAGLDVRYYQGIHTAVISDMLSGQYFIDATRANSVSAANNVHRNDPSWTYQKLNTGDIVYRDYTGHVMQEGVFATLEYTQQQLSAFLNGSFSYTNYWRVDRFYYDEQHRKSEVAGFVGGTVKGGVNYNINQHNNVFVNAGFISRAPKFNAAFMSSNTSHMLNKDARNEKIASVEVGYGFHNEYVNLIVNGYYTRWMDKTMSKYTTFDNQENGYVNMTGVGAQHMGLEFEFKTRPAKWVELSAMLSLGDWRWKGNDITGYMYDEHGNAVNGNGEQVATGSEDHAWAKINLDNIRVGGQAQTTANLGVTFKPFKGFRIGGEYTLYDRNYSYYSFSGSNLTVGKTVSVVEPYRCPVGGAMDVRVSYTFDIGPLRATLAGNVTNVLNQHYIEKAWSAQTVSQAVTENTKDNIYFFYNKGRQWNIRLKLAF
ncbi:MAG: carboxypeptidase-like regulatory domain-containing protein [Paludibacteraceae bacterium]|nr:carboxypeptidase-like regulatory domain-containing protein [Paludibacteraceae bacterium]MBQ9704617.1 carboxypeptidase-like regulatory domain-containing protein [Paludibacteraceae bacterium]